MNATGIVLPVIEQALVRARVLAKGKAKRTGTLTDDRGNVVPFVPAAERVRVWSETAPDPMVNLSLRQRGERIEGGALVQLWRVTSMQWGVHDEWETVTPLDRNVPPDTAVVWARTHGRSAAIKTLIDPDEEDVAPEPTQAPAPATPTREEDSDGGPVRTELLPPGYRVNTRVWTMREIRTEVEKETRSREEGCACTTGTVDIDDVRYYRARWSTARKTPWGSVSWLAWRTSTLEPAEFHCRRWTKVSGDWPAHPDDPTPEADTRPMVDVMGGETLPDISPLVRVPGPLASGSVSAVASLVTVSQDETAGAAGAPIPDLSLEARPSIKSTPAGAVPVGTTNTPHRDASTDEALVANDPVKPNPLGLYNSGRMSPLWRVTTKGDQEARAFFDGHYSRQTPGSPHWMRPGFNFVLRADDTEGRIVALFSARSPSLRSVPGVPCSHLGRHQAKECTVFRRLDGPRASDLIAAAEEALNWPEAEKALHLAAAGPVGVLITGVSSEHTAERRSRHVEAGQCFRAAGWVTSTKLASKGSTADTWLERPWSNPHRNGVSSGLPSPDLSSKGSAHPPDPSPVEPAGDVPIVSGVPGGAAPLEVCPSCMGLLVGGRCADEDCDVDVASEWAKGCGRVGPALVRCATCGRSKAPRGRSVALEEAGGMCGDECPGYYADPKPSGLWPRERCEPPICGHGETPLIEPSSEALAALEGVIAKRKAAKSEGGSLSMTYADGSVATIAVPPAAAKRLEARLDSGDDPTGMKGRASRWGFRPLRVAKSVMECIECGEKIIRGQGYRTGADVPSLGAVPGQRLSPRGIPFGRAHESCREALAEGRDPRAAQEVKA